MRKTILVVEDFASIRNFLCDTLERAGYKTLGLSNGREAFELLKSGEVIIDLVLSDYNMPECTGFDLLVQMKAEPSVADIPVVFLTTESDPEKMREAQKVGLAAWIKKPYRAETFFAQLSNAIMNGR
ncbi:MAG TPA: response regulator [Ohtaekwangia sp.]|uniref:response regulator n=1 Tax=Ohtaekwangia sp. TaxID=2066019 RepID=UPI002F951DBE